MPRKRRENKHLPAGVYRHGKKYRMRVYIDGRPAWKDLGGKLEQALSEYARTLNQTTPGTIGDGIDRYVDEYLEQLARDTRRTEKPRLERLKRVFGHMHPDGLVARDIYAYMDQRPPYAGNKEVSRLSAVYQKMIRWGMASTNPCRGIERNREPARNRYVTDEELETALAVCLDQAFHGRRSAAVVYGVMRLEALTGRRESDILRLKKSDITDDGLQFLEGKTGKKTVFDITPELGRAIQEIKRIARVKQPSFFVLPNRDGEQCSTGSFNRAWQSLRPVLEAAGVEPFQPRDIRAKFATDYEEAGGDASDALQHSDPKVTRKHYLRKPKRIRLLR